jgi:predicted adenylyl cyclase CyaB
MPRNIEVKAKIDGIEALVSTAAALADREPVEIDQDDTFFACPNGRLKLRQLSPQEGELIFYLRPDGAEPKESFYVIARTSTPSAMRETLSRAYGVVGRVRKRRTLFLAGRTRIHFDRVEGLGDFLELEVVLAENESPQSGRDEADRLLASLGILPSQLQARAYVDLLARARR